MVQAQRARRSSQYATIFQTNGAGAFIFQEFLYIKMGKRI